METQPSNKYSIWFVLIVGVFVTCLITANIIAVKLVDIAGWIVPAGVVVFPISYIVGDVMTEVYGYRQARRVIWLGFFCNLLAVVAIIIGQTLPGAAFWDAQADGAPGPTARPTLTWAVPSETLVSAPFALKFPANLATGDYRILIGVYNPYSGQRLTTDQGDQVLLATVHVSAAG